MSLYQHILCTTDFSTASDKALKQAIDLREITGAKLTLIHCVEPLVVPNYAFSYIDVSNEVIKEGKKQMVELVKKHHLHDVDTIVESKSARSGIIEFAENLKVDLIIMGRRGQHDLLDRVLGSTTHYVINHATCNVLITQE